MECRRGLAMRILSVCSSVCPSVCLSVRLSVCQTCALWQNCRKIGPYFYIIRKIFYPSLLRRMVGGGRPLLPEILGQTDPRRSEIAAIEPIFARSSSALAKKVQLTIRKSTTRFPMSLGCPLSSKGGLKNAKRPISVKIALRLKKVCYTKFLCVKTVSGKVVRQLAQLTVQTWLVGSDFFYLKCLIQDAQLSQRDRAAGYISFGRKWKTGTQRQYFTDIVSLASTTVT